MVLGDFFKSVKFKIIIGIFALLIGVMIYTGATQGFSSLPSKVIGIISAPFQSLSSKISTSTKNFFDKFLNADKNVKENEQLKQKLSELQNKLVEYETIKNENQQLREIVGLKKQHPDFEFEAGTVIARGPNDPFATFTIDVGSNQGVKYRDPVVTPLGLVGVVTEVGPTYSVVTAILHPDIGVGAYQTRTNDTGVVTGSVKLAEQGKCKLGLLPRQVSIAIGDIITTSGETGLFPKGLVIGTVEVIENETSGSSVYAVIQPSEDIFSVENVFVIKNFNGKSEVSSSEKKGE